MKRWLINGLFLLPALAACVKGPEPVEGPTRKGTFSSELSAIDSLLWQRPDSALACLLPYFDTCCTAEHDRHYAHLLLSELLYKNDYAQTNRAELQDAVVYFDSLAQNDNAHTRRSHCGLDPQSPSQKDILAFLAARAHYIYGVGYYEQDSAVPACREYLKALEIMEERFAEKELVGKKAQFMAYTNNRLGELFSAQYMMEPAIACCEQSLYYCKIAPTSPFGGSNTLYRLGVQYDKLDEMEKAREYYDQALEALPSHQGPIYRDILASYALCEYQLCSISEHPLDTLRRILTQAEGEIEILARYITIGDIFFEEGLYDSALVYLEPILEYDENVTRRIQAANFLRIIYDSLGYEDKADGCIRILADQKKTEGQNKALVSQLEGLFQDYVNQKQAIKAAQEKRKAVVKTVKILVPAALVLSVVVILIIRKRNKKRLTQQKAESQKELEKRTNQHESELKRQQEESDRVLKETENRAKHAFEEARKEHKMEQAAIAGRLKQSNEKVRELKERIRRQDELDATSKQADVFKDEPICRLIMERVNEGQFLSQMDCKIYKDYALSKEQVIALRRAADLHFGLFTLRLAKAYPELTKTDLDYCCLYLLGLTDADIAALMQRAYNTVNERNSKLRRIFGSENTVSITLQAIANDSVLI